MVNRLEKSRETFQRLFGMQPPEVEDDPELMEILRRTIFCDVFSTGDLNDQTRELITITALATMQTLPQLEAHLHSCLNVGISPIELREAIYQLAPIIGFPRTLNAVGVLNKVFEANNIDVPLENQAAVSDETRYEKGLEIQEKILKTDLKDDFKDFSELPEFITAFGFGDFYTREALNLNIRQLLQLVSIVTIGEKEAIKNSILGNINIGNSKETVYAVLVQALPYIGFSNVLVAVNILKEI